MNNYLIEYCRVSKNMWCPEETSTFQAKIDEFEKFNYKNSNEREITKQMADMSRYAQHRAETAQKKWVEMNETAFAIGMVLGFWNLIFNMALNFSGREGNENFIHLIPVGISAYFYVAQLNQELTPELAALVMIVLSVAFSIPYLVDLAKKVCSFFRSACADGESTRYSLVCLSLFVAMVLFNIITRIQEYSGEVIECFVMIVLAYFWMFIPSEKRTESIVPMVMIICATRFQALLDKSDEWDIRLVMPFQPTPLAIQFVPFLVLFIIENKINRRLSFSWLH